MSGWRNSLETFSRRPFSTDPAQQLLECPLPRFRVIPLLERVLAQLPVDCLFEILLDLATDGQAIAVKQLCERNQPGGRLDVTPIHRHADAEVAGVTEEEIHASFRCVVL